MLGKFYYPAVFTIADDGITITYPDFDFIVTQGMNLQDAFEKAEEALGIGIADYLERGIMPPAASDILKYKTSENTYTALISIDMDEWTKTYSTKSIRKNVTLPAWLNQLAEKENINFSSLLQEALLQKMGLSKRHQ